MEALEFLPTITALLTIGCSCSFTCIGCFSVVGFPKAVSRSDSTAFSQDDLPVAVCSHSLAGGWGGKIKGKITKKLINKCKSHTQSKERFLETTIS